MQSHKLSLDTVLTVYDKDLNKIKEFTPPREIEMPDDYIDLLVKEASGAIVQKVTIPFQSFTRQFQISFDHALMCQGGIVQFGYTYATGSDGTKTNGHDLNWPYNYGAIGDTITGIVVGTGSAAVSFHNIKLAGLINHGSGVGQLYYNAMLYDAISYSGSYITKGSFRRNFLNQNASSITVTEVGYMCKHYSISSNCLNARDLLQYDGTPISITIANGQTLEVVYNFYTDITSGFTAQFMKWFIGGSTNLNTWTWTQISGIDSQGQTVSIPASLNFLIGSLAPSGSWPWGISVGSDDGTLYPLSSSNYKLGNQLVHGSTDGTLFYGDTIMSPFTSSVVSQSMTTYLTRRFENKSTGTIQVKEVGVISSGNGYNLLARRLIGTLNITSGQTLDVAFLFTVSSSVV